MKKIFLVLIFLKSIITQSQCFIASSNPSVMAQPSAITTADFNSDGLADLAIANKASNKVSILLGNGTGSFAIAVNNSVGLNPTSITSADFNNDGKIDLAVANNSSSNVSILMGNGAGIFASTIN
jgi:FG-GAP-like repeat